MSKEYEPEVVRELTRMAQAAAPQWGLSDRAEVKLLNLSENATFMASEPEGGREIVIRMQRRGYSSKEAIRSEMAWISALKRDHVVDLAAPVKTVDDDYIVDLCSESGEERMAVAFEKLEGHEPEISEADLAHWFEILGGITARLHEHARSWQAPEWFSRRVWDYDGIIGDHAYWGSWKDSQGLTPEGAELFSRALARLEPRIAAFGKNRENFGVIHGDMRATNLLVDGDKLQVIDFDDMGFGWYMFDFGAALSFMEQSPEAPRLASAWVRGYESVHPLSKQEKSLLPDFSMLRRIELCAWCASHSEVPFAAKNGRKITEDTMTLCREYLDGKYLFEEE